jgi:hypothetical protein
MDDLVSAAQTNDLDRLRRLVKVEKANNPGLEYTSAMQDACHAAACQNHPAALNLLLDSGCWRISAGEHTEPDRVSLKRLTILPIPATVIGALAKKCKDVFDALIARGWDVSSNLGHIGDALT